MSRGLLLSHIQIKSYLIHLFFIGKLYFTNLSQCAIPAVPARVQSPQTVRAISHIVTCYHNKLCLVARDQKELKPSCYILSNSLLICRSWVELINLRYGVLFKHNIAMRICLTKTYNFTYSQIVKVVLINALHMEINWSLFYQIQQ